MLVGLEQKVSGVVLTTSVATVIIVRGTLGAASVIIKAANAAVANTITITALPSVSSGGQATTPTVGTALMNLYGATGDLSNGAVYVTEIVPNPTTSPKGNLVPTITTPYVEVQAVQTTAGGACDFYAYVVFPTDHHNQTGGYALYPLKA